MIKLEMQKTYFHNNKLSYKNKVIKRTSQLVDANVKSVVDINILLNKIKSEKKNEIKRQIILFSLVTLTLILFGTFITVIK